MLILDDIKKYFVNDIYHSLPFKYPEQNAKIAAFVFDTELKDNTFLPGNMPAGDRAEFAVFTQGGFICRNAEHLFSVEKEINRIKLLGKIINLTHRQYAHNEDTQSEIDLCYSTLEAEDVELTEYEKEMISAVQAAGFWNP